MNKDIQEIDCRFQIADCRLKDIGNRSGLIWQSKICNLKFAMFRIAIASPQEVVSLNRRRLRDIVRQVLQGEGIRDAEISLAFVDNATIHQLNKRYLKHDEPTDVLSFPLGEAGAKISGEIVVGMEVAVAEARRRGHHVQDELALYVIHGLLHLCSYDDKTEKQRKAIRGRERHYLKALANQASKSRRGTNRP